MNFELLNMNSCLAFYHPIHYPISAEPGVPYNVTVRASTAVGIGEPVSIVVFSVEQGDSATIAHLGLSYNWTVRCTSCPHFCMANAFLAWS